MQPVNERPPILVIFEGQRHPLSTADLLNVMRGIWPANVDAPLQLLFDTLNQPTHVLAENTVQVLRRVYSLLTPEAQSGIFRPHWEDATKQCLCIDLEKRATTKGALGFALREVSEEINPAYLLACYLTWLEQTSMVSFGDLMHLQGTIEAALVEGEATQEATRDLFMFLKAVAPEPGQWLPVGF